MPTCFYLAEVIGSGTRKDPYRPACAGVMKDFSAAIPTDENGVPLTNTCLVKVTDADQSQMPKGVTPIPRAEEFVAQALIREEQRKAGQRVVSPDFVVAASRLIDEVKEVGREFSGYELKQIDEMLGTSPAKEASVK